MLGLIKIRTIQCKEGLAKLNSTRVKADLSADLKVLTLITETKSLVGFFLSSIEKSFATDDNSEIEFFTIPNVTWQKHQENGTGYQVLVGNDDGEIRLITLKNINNESRVQISSNWTLRDVDFIIDGFDSEHLEYEVFNFRGNQAVFCIDKQSIVTVTITPGQSLFVKSHHQLMEDGSKARHVIGVNNIVCFLNHEGSVISAFDLEYGVKLWQYSLLESLDVTKFFISLDNNYVILIGKDESVYYTELLPNAKKTSSKSKSFITAFSKQNIATTTKQDGKNKAREKLLTELESGTIKSVVASENRIYICVQNENGAVFHSFQNGSLEAKERFLNGCVVIGTTDSSCPPLILSEDYLYTFSPEFSTTEFVNKLMMYSSGHTVEYLSLLNEWQGISIELDILELGLKNGQLHLVSFFLRAKSEEFGTMWKNLSHNSGLLETFEQKLDNWAKIFEMLKLTLVVKLKSSSYLQFAEQILKVTINVLIQLLKTVTMDFAKSNREFQEAEVLFAKYLKEMRSFLQNKINWETQVDEIKCGIEITQNWSTMSEEDIIRTSIESSCIPIALWYFNNVSVDKISLDYIQERARNFSIGYLEERHLEKSIETLTNSGLNPIDEFLKVFRHTPERSLRNFLLPHLQRQSALNEEDIKATEFVQLLEKLYPCSDFFRAKEQKIESLQDVELRYPIESGLKEGKNCNLEIITKAIGSIIRSRNDKSNWEGFSYLRISQDLVKNLSDTEKEEVLVPALLNGYDLDVKLPSPEVVWSYLLKRNLDSHLINWIETFYSNSEVELTRSFPHGWPISLDMLNLVPGSSSLVKDKVLNSFAKFGVLCEDELEDISLLLKRLGSAEVVLSKPHPFSLPRASMTEGDYYHRVIHYCLEHSLFNFLYFFLQEDSRYSQCEFCPLCRVPIVLAMIDFCRWSEDSLNENLRFEAIVSSACLLNNIPEASLEALCKSGATNLSLAAMFFSPLKLTSLLDDNSEIGKIMKEKLDNSVSEFPMIHRVLSRGWPTKNIDDISIYSLLVGNSFFDPTRLFGWQSNNKIANEEAPSEVPHFSSPSLVQQHDLKQSIDVYYYLMEGRPNYAYLKFVSREILTWKTLTTQRLTLLMLEASNLALRNYATTKITSSCIAFLELLDLDSQKLRTDLQVAAIIHKDHYRKDEGKEINELVSLLITMNETKESAKELVLMLDSIITERISSGNKLQNLEYHLFILLIQFSNYHDLDYLPTFLNIFAKRKDWFSLIILLQVLKIPREQALEVVRKIPDKCLVDHLTTAFQNPVATTYGAKPAVVRRNSVPRKIKPKIRESVDVRSALYSKIGLSPSLSSAADTSDDENVVSDDCGSSVTTEESLSSDECLGQPEDLFEQLIIVSRSQNPGVYLLKTSIEFENPVHALISASLTDTNWILCACSWIIASLKLELKLPIEEIYPGKLKVVNFSLNDLSVLLIKLVELGLFKLLNRCANLFFPHSPLLSMTEYLVMFFYSKKYNLSVTKLEEFKSKMSLFESWKNTKHSIGDLKWMEDLIMKLIQHSLILSDNCYEQKLFLHHLSSSNLKSIFTSKETSIIDFDSLHSLLTCVEECEIEVPIKDLLNPRDHPVFVKAATSVVRNLQNAKFYKEALQFGTLANIPKETILILQLNNDASFLEENYDSRKSFWEKCDIIFSNENIAAETAANFFNKWCEKALTYLERYYILVLVVKWSKKAGSSDLSEKEMAMWLCCFRCRMESLLKDGDSDQTKLVIDSYGGDSADLFYWELWDFNSVTLEQEPLQLKFETEQTALNEVLLALLDLGFIGQAWKLAVMFKYYSFELEAVLTCLKLVREICLPSEIDPKVAELLDGNATTLSVLEIIEKIQKSIPHGKIGCQRVKIHYQISQMLWSPYTQIAAEKDSLRIFLNLLNCSNPGRFNLAKELCVVRKIPDEEVVNCIFKIITDYIKKSVILTDAKVTEISFKIDKDNEAFSQQLFQLCKEPSTLGYKLLGDITTGDENDEDSKKDKKCHIYEVAVCVSCHACFTFCCHMEGISKTLSKVRQLTAELEEKQEFSLMISLLTGIERYGELKYIFDILREREQFDLLLNKNTEELPSLRLALLDYIKRHHGVSDREVYSMLAVKFKMFREIAQMLENSAKARLKNLKESDISKISFKSNLEAILQDFEASAKKYVEDGCLRHAERVLRHAELVALQIHLSTNNIWILRLDEVAQHKFLVEHKQFQHSFIVASFYQHHQSWDQALFHNLIERGDWDYFRDFQTHLGVNPDIIGGVAKRFALSRTKDERQRNNIKRLLNFCKDVTVRYQIANQLGFMDITSDLLKGDAGAYLQDVIAQKKLPDDFTMSSF